jgi:hypothetical protein
MIRRRLALADLEIGLELDQREMLPMLGLVEQRPALMRTKRRGSGGALQSPAAPRRLSSADTHQFAPSFTPFIVESRGEHCNGFAREDLIDGGGLHVIDGQDVGEAQVRQPLAKRGCVA